MIAAKYSVNQHPILTLLTWVKSGQIAIPEIQRPFVWNATKVRNLLDSLYQGYPVGYLIAWQNPTIRLKDGKTSEGKRILIDGQQRVTALMAALLGEEIIDKNYEKIHIRIAFHPIEMKFEVSNPAIQKDPTWVTDISLVFAPEFDLLKLLEIYCSHNPLADRNIVFKNIQSLQGVINNHIGLIDLNSDLTIETVTEIFIRINSEGMVLSQADFAMSKIASNETYGGSLLRKAIDYFCHLAKNPDFFQIINKQDKEFIETDFFQKMTWLKNEIDDIYDPSYTDMLRVAFTSEFKRGRLQDLVALLSGRNFETKQYEEEIAKESFERLKKGILNFTNESHFKRFTMIIRSSGFIDSSLIGSSNTLNFAYIVYLFLRSQGMPASDIESAVRKWFIMSILTGRYSSSPETAFDYDIRKIYEDGFRQYVLSIEQSELSHTFWTMTLPQAMNTSAASSPYFHVFKAAQIKMNDKGFLSGNIGVQDLILNKSDVHHLFPKNYLKQFGLKKGGYNQIANFAMTQTEINIAIGDKPPSVYFQQVLEQCNGGKKLYGGITDLNDLRDNLKMHCIPEGIENMSEKDYDNFLGKRRQLMADKIRRYYQDL